MTKSSRCCIPPPVQSNHSSLQAHVLLLVLLIRGSEAISPSLSLTWPPVQHLFHPQWVPTILPATPFWSLGHSGTPLIFSSSSPSSWTRTFEQDQVKSIYAVSFFFFFFFFCHVLPSTSCDLFISPITGAVPLNGECFYPFLQPRNLTTLTGGTMTCYPPPCKGLSSSQKTLPDTLSKFLTINPTFLLNPQLLYFEDRYLVKT